MPREQLLPIPSSACPWQLLMCIPSLRIYLFWTVCMNGAFCAWLLTLTWCNDLVVIHTVVCTSTSFLWRNSSPLHAYTHNLFIHSSTDGHRVIPSVVMNSALLGQVFGAASSSILLTSSIIPLFK